MVSHPVICQTSGRLPCHPTTLTVSLFPYRCQCRAKVCVCVCKRTSQDLNSTGVKLAHSAFPLFDSDKAGAPTCGTCILWSFSTHWPPSFLSDSWVKKISTFPKCVELLNWQHCPYGELVNDWSEVSQLTPNTETCLRTVKRLKFKIWEL